MQTPGTAERTGQEDAAATQVGYIIQQGPQKCRQITTPGKRGGSDTFCLGSVEVRFELGLEECIGLVGMKRKAIC